MLADQYLTALAAHKNPTPPPVNADEPYVPITFSLNAGNKTNGSSFWWVLMGIFPATFTLSSGSTTIFHIEDINGVAQDGLTISMLTQGAAVVSLNRRMLIPPGGVLIPNSGLYPFTGLIMQAGTLKDALLLVMNQP